MELWKLPAGLLAFRDDFVELGWRDVVLSRQLSECIVLFGFYLSRSLLHVGIVGSGSAQFRELRFELLKALDGAIDCSPLLFIGRGRTW